MFPKNVPKAWMELTWDESYVDDTYRGDTAIVWFQKVLPRLKKEKNYPFVDLVQEEGDTLFIPSGNFFSKKY